MISAAAGVRRHGGSARVCRGREKGRSRPRTSRHPSRRTVQPRQLWGPLGEACSVSQESPVRAPRRARTLRSFAPRHPAPHVPRPPSRCARSPTPPPAAERMRARSWDTPALRPRPGRHPGCPRTSPRTPLVSLSTWARFARTAVGSRPRGARRHTGVSATANRRLLKMLSKSKFCGTCSPG